ncbi:MAG TPA: lysylphosphatidylglycerol synthase transmembrane domain-containing protein [Planctomycetota bacterium]|jgi:hypothetical protein
MTMPETEPTQPPASLDTEPTPPARRGWLGTAAKLALAIGILLWLYFSGRLDLSLLSGPNVSWLLVLGSTAVLLLSLPVVSWRYQLALNGLGLPCGYGQAFSWTMIGMFFDMVMPSATGGDLIKAVYAVRAYGKGRRSLAILSVMLDRVLGIFGLFCLALMVCLAGGHTIDANARLRGMTWLLSLVCGGGMIAFLIAVSPHVAESSWRQKLVSMLPLHERLERVYQGLVGLRRQPKILLLMLGLSVVNQAIVCASVLVLARGLGMRIAPLEGAIVVPLALFVNAFGFAGGFGVGEWGFDELFRRLLNIRGGASLALAFHVLSFVFRLLGLPFYLLSGRVTAEETEDGERR